MRVTSLLAPGGSPKGLPYPDTEGFLAIRRGGAEGELPRRGKRSWPGPRLGAPFRKGFALRGEFLFHVEKEPKDARGRAQSAEAAVPPLPPCRPSPRTPITGGRVLARFCSTSGAQNLSGFPRFNPGHRALAFQKLKLVRFHIGAWLCRAGGGWC